MKPQCLILLDDELEVKQNLDMVCNAKPSLFAYPITKKDERNQEKAKAKTKKDVLSVQHRINVRKAVKGGTVVIPEEPKVEEVKEEEKPKEEEELFIISNPSRILYNQEN